MIRAALSLCRLCLRVFATSAGVLNRVRCVVLVALLRWILCLAAICRALFCVAVL